MKEPIFNINEINRIKNIVTPLVTWYGENARVLPWRENTVPYRVWVSEIMLQQTQVETVIPYYNRFMAQIPDIKCLSKLKEEQLLKLWEGLGYYSRARNLQKAAKMIMDKYGGKFPETYCEILSLPGVGKYTAGAISSICFELPTPAVDGNVMRVITRLTECDSDIAIPAVKDKVTEMLSEIYPKTHSGDFTQSLMELGATVCLPKGSPKCGICPIAFLCNAYQNGTQATFPVKTKKAAKKKELKTVFLLYCGDKIAVKKRAADILLGGLWEFPNTTGNLTPEQVKDVLTQWGISIIASTPGMPKKHIFTHIEWYMTSYIVICNNMLPEFVWVTREKLANDLALPSAFQPFFNQL